MEGLYRVLSEAIDAGFEKIRALSMYIHDHPEMAFAEKKACAAMTSFLEEAGYVVTPNAGGLETAFVAEAGQPWAPGVTTVALMAEYDALPIGHACGHNLIAAISAGAALALKKILPETGGRVLVIGCPAEERGGGKVLLCDRGVFDRADFAMQVHPASYNMVMRGGLTARVVDVEFFGKMAHSSAPENGVNALTACLAMFENINAQRPALPAGTNINGVILEGGKACNIIPGYAKASFAVRATTVTNDAIAMRALQNAAQAGCGITGAEVKIDAPVLYAERYPNLPMARVYKEHLEGLGERVDFPPKDMKLASSDVGNVSLQMPMIQPYLKVSDADNHTPEFAQDAASDFAHAQMAKAAKALAMTACDLLTDASLREAAKRYFAANTPVYTAEELGYEQHAAQKKQASMCPQSAP